MKRPSRLVCCGLLAAFALVFLAPFALDWIFFFRPRLAADAFGGAARGGRGRACAIGTIGLDFRPGIGIMGGANETKGRI